MFKALSIWLEEKEEYGSYIHGASSSLRPKVKPVKWAVRPANA